MSSDAEYLKVHLSDLCLKKQKINCTLKCNYNVNLIGINYHIVMHHSIKNLTSQDELLHLAVDITLAIFTDSSDNTLVLHVILRNLSHTIILKGCFTEVLMRLLHCTTCSTQFARSELDRMLDEVVVSGGVASQHVICGRSYKFTPSKLRARSCIM